MTLFWGNRIGLPALGFALTLTGQVAFAQERGTREQALTLLDKAAALAPKANDIRYHLAAGLHKAGDKARARKELDKALADGKPFAQVEEARALLKQL